jgi:hypothetical protein
MEIPGRMSSLSESGNKTRLSAILGLTLLAVGMLALLPATAANAQSLTAWNKTTQYPTSVSNTECVTSSGYIYCLDDGGAAYYATVSASGVGAWTKTTSYPLDISAESCVSYGGYVYCVSGFCDSIENPGCSPHPEAPTTDDFYAKLSSSGIGAWTKTASIPVGGLSLSCAVSSGYVYCIGGDQTVGTIPSVNDSYAPISASGIGAWKSTTAYPIAIHLQSCVASGSDIYCTGGGTGNGNQITGASYYAAISSSGVGAWTKTTSYPTALASSQCIVASGYVYCVGGSSTGSGNSATSVYYSPVSATGIGAWTSTASYPDVNLASCSSYTGYIYCVGTQQAVYYAAIDAPPTTSTLTVASQSLSGTPLTGFYTVLFQDGKVVTTGYTTATFTLDDGQSYVIQADSYGNCIFAHWSNGETSASMPISINANTKVTAVYNCGGTSDSSVTVQSQDQNGNWIFGYYAALKSSSGAVATGYTTKTFVTSAGQSYTVQMASFGSCTFSHWNGGSTKNPRSFTASSSAMTFTAVYNCS